MEKVEKRKEVVNNLKTIENLETSIISESVNEDQDLIKDSKKSKIEKKKEKLEKKKEQIKAKVGEKADKKIKKVDK